MRKKEIHHPYDFAFRQMDMEFPQEFHSAIGAPGIFVKKSGIKTLTKKHRKMEMDSSSVIDPDFEVIFEPMVLIHEHQKEPVTPEKIHAISDYVIQKIADEHLPPYVLISTNTDIEKSMREIERTPSMKIKLNFLDLGEEDNKKRLSNISYKINHNHKLDISDILQLGIIALYVKKEYAVKRMEKLVELYRKLEKLTPKEEYVLYSVLYAMIDAHVNEKDKFEEMINMINQQTRDEIKTEFLTVTLLKEENRELKTENNEINNENTKLKKRIEELESQLNNK